MKANEPHDLHPEPVGEVGVVEPYNSFYTWVTSSWLLAAIIDSNCLHKKEHSILTQFLL